MSESDDLDCVAEENSANQVKKSAQKHHTMKSDENMNETCKDVTKLLSKSIGSESSFYRLKRRTDPNFKRRNNIVQKQRETLLMLWLNRKRETLRLINDYSSSKSKKTQMLHIRMHIWVAIGFYKYNMKEERLFSVCLKYEKIGLLPKGYLYPELHLDN